LTARGEKERKEERKCFLDGAAATPPSAGEFIAVHSTGFNLAAMEELKLKRLMNVG